MQLREILIGPWDSFDVRRTAAHIDTSKEVKQLYALLSDTDAQVAYRAAWVLTHIDERWLCLLADKQSALAAAARLCPQSGMRRLLLTVLWRLPLPEEPDPDMLDFCLEGMLAAEEPHGVRMLCMKLAYEICRSCPDLRHEFSVTLDLLEPQLLPPSLRSVQRNVRRALAKNQSLQPKKHHHE